MALSSPSLLTILLPRFIKRNRLVSFLIKLFSFRFGSVSRWPLDPTRDVSL